MAKATMNQIGGILFNPINMAGMACGLGEPPLKKGGVSRMEWCCLAHGPMQLRGRGALRAGVN